MASDSQLDKLAQKNVELASERAKASKAEADVKHYETRDEEYVNDEGNVILGQKTKTQVALLKADGNTEAANQLTILRAAQARQENVVNSKSWYNSTDWWSYKAFGGGWGDDIYAAFANPSEVEEINRRNADNLRAALEEPGFKENINDAQKKYDAALEKARKEADEARKKAELLARQNAASNRIGAQAALILSIEEILSDKKHNRLDVKYRNFATTRLEDFRKGSNKGKTLNEITNVLTKKDGTELFFREVPTKLLSALVPSVKIYKTFFPDLQFLSNEQISDAVKNKELYDEAIKKGFDWRVPFDDSNFIFGNQTSEFLAGGSFLKKKDVEDDLSEEAKIRNRYSIAQAKVENLYTLNKKAATTTEQKYLEPAGTLHAAGIKSLYYKYAGTDPFSVLYNIELDLELYFRNIENILTTIEFDSSDSRFVEDTSEKYKNCTFSFSYADLIYQAENEKRNVKSDTLKINTDFYLIKVVVGYAPIEQKYFDSLTQEYSQEERSKLKQAIESSEQVFILNPVSQDISFGEDGSLTVKIKNNARANISMHASSTDIFKSSEEAKKIFNLNSRLKSFIEQNRKQSDIAKKDIEKNGKKGGKSKDEINKEIQNYLKNIEKANERQKKLIENQKFYLKRNMYNNIYKRLIGIEQLPGRGKDIGVYYAYIKTDVIGANSKGVVDQDAIKRRKKILDQKKIFNGINRLNIYDQRSLRTNLVSTGPSKDATDEAKRRAQEEGASRPSDQSILDKEQKTFDQKLKTLNSEKLKGGGNYSYSKIKFVFLGDILDAAAECLNIRLKGNEDPTLLTPRIVLGEMPIFIPTQIDQTVEAYKITDIKQLYINIADIPISLDYLYQFLLDKIIQPMRESYPLLEFIRDLISVLIKDAINVKAFGDTIVQSQVKLSTKAIDLKIGAGEKNPLTNLEPSYFRDPSTSLVTPITKDLVDSYKQKNINSNLPIESLSSYSSVGPSKIGVSYLSYFFIFSSSEIPKFFQGKIEEDEKNGVYHVRIGNDKGIVKKISFSKTDTVGAREYAAQQHGMNNAVLLKNVYNANISLFGNNVLNIGDYLFIEPIYSNGRRAISIDDKLGISGYYLITEVKGNISDFQFSSDLKCMFISPIIEKNSGKD